MRLEKIKEHYEAMGITDPSNDTLVMAKDRLARERNKNLHSPRYLGGVAAAGAVQLYLAGQRKVGFRAGKAANQARLHMSQESVKNSKGIVTRVGQRRARKTDLAAEAAAYGETFEQSRFDMAADQIIYFAGVRAGKVARRSKVRADKIDQRLEDKYQTYADENFKLAKMARSHLKRRADNKTARTRRILNGLHQGIQDYQEHEDLIQHVQTEKNYWQLVRPILDKSKSITDGLIPNDHDQLDLKPIKDILFNPTRTLNRSGSGDLQELAHKSLVNALGRTGPGEPIALLGRGVFVDHLWDKVAEKVAGVRHAEQFGLGLPGELDLEVAKTRSEERNYIDGVAVLVHELGFVKKDRYGELEQTYYRRRGGKIEEGTRTIPNVDVMVGPRVERDEIEGGIAMYVPFNPHNEFHRMVFDGFPPAGSELELAITRDSETQDSAMSLSVVQF